MGTQRTSIALSIETYRRLHNVKRQIQEIVRKNLDYDAVVKIILCTRPLEDQLVEIMVEQEALYPTKRRAGKEDDESY